MQAGHPGDRARASTSTSSKPKPRYWMFKHGMQAAAYPAIVGSGPMGNQWHYEDNGRQMKAGELVVMDYAGSLDYLTIDITRTWPVSGRFTDAQLQGLRVRARGAEGDHRGDQARRDARHRRGGSPKTSSRARGFDPRYAYVGHYVGSVGARRRRLERCRSRPGW